MWSERTLRGPLWGVARLLIVPFHTSPFKHFFMWHLLLWSEFGSEFFSHFQDLKVFNFHCSILSLFHHHQFKFLLSVELKVLFGGCYMSSWMTHRNIFVLIYEFVAWQLSDDPGWELHPTWGRFKAQLWRSDQSTVHTSTVHIIYRAQEFTVHTVYRAYKHCA